MTHGVSHERPESYLDPMRDWIETKNKSVVMACLCVLIALIVSSRNSLWAQVSPGALSRAHRSLEGARHCVDCHELNAQPPARKCLDCHREIERRLDARRGLHPSLVGSESGGKPCSRCHPEHHGRDFNLVRWETEPKHFDHQRTGYSLTGRHAALVCNQCHQAPRIAGADAAEITVKDRSRTFLGLSRECRACHGDQHRGQLSAQCETCHDTARWQNAAQYDHAKARFQLSGPHEKVQCLKCHPEALAADSKPYRQFRNLSFDDCAPCHRDPHGGAFQAACKTCHALPDWKPAAISVAFNHARSRYPLLGKHAGLPCKACHSKSAFNRPVAHNLCGDCHRQSPHKSQFAARADGGDCSACHKVQGFKPSTFDLARHGTTAFSLDGKHAGIRCDQCHKPWTSALVFKISDTRCAQCHADKHAGQFRPALNSRQCEMCHTVRGFRPSTFTLARHQTTRFPLPGAHGAVVCGECHADAGGRTDAARYRFDNLACSSCHQDIHKGQFAVRMAQPGPSGAPVDCTACHTNTAWKDLPGFDHRGTNFPLAGGHRQAPCDRCHRRGEPKPEPGSVVFRSAPRKCDSCHQDEHGGQFASAGGTDCTRCHSDRQWKPSTFDHDRGSTYVLTGVHQNTKCAACHISRTNGDRKMIVFKGIPRQCSGCHAGSAPGA